MEERLCDLGHRIWHQLGGSTPRQHISQFIDAVDYVMDDARHGVEKRDSNDWILSNVHFVMPSDEKKENEQQSGYRVKMNTQVWY